MREANLRRIVFEQARDAEADQPAEEGEGEVEEEMGDAIFSNDNQEDGRDSTYQNPSFFSVIAKSREKENMKKKK